MRLLLLFLTLTSYANANPYFRFIGGPGYRRQVLTEACFNPKQSIGDTTECTSIPIITHSHKDGYVLIPNEDWSPLNLGAAFGNAKPLFILGPAANISPAVKSFLLYMLNSTTGPDSYVNLKSILGPDLQSSGPDLTINMGIKWGVYPTQRFFTDSIILLSIGPALLF